MPHRTDPVRTLLAVAGAALLAGACSDELVSPHAAPDANAAASVAAEGNHPLAPPSRRLLRRRMEEWHHDATNHFERNIRSPLSENPAWTRIRVFSKGSKPICLWPAALCACFDCHLYSV
jgi:hypothetical protein